MPGLEIRKLRDPQEYIEAVEVQKKAWNMEDYREAAPAHLLRGLADNGGLVLGAFLEGRLVGISYGWPASYYFYSHATGVIESTKYKGVGYKLKLSQREWILKDYGFSLAKWTFDPLQSLNSRFNLGKLGVIVKEYYPNYYGEIRDTINKGIGSDRVKAEWWLTSQRVLTRISSSKLCLSQLKNMNPVSAFGVEHRDGLPVPGARRSEDELLASEIIVVPIPRSISSLRDVDPSLALKWREATRWAYQFAFQNGYILVDNVDGGIDYTINILWRAAINTILSSPEPWRCQG